MKLMLKIQQPKRLTLRTHGTVPQVTQLPTYDGSYEVTPTLEKQVLLTSGKLMSDNVTVTAVPTYEVTNSSGGTTFYIAKE